MVVAWCRGPITGGAVANRRLSRGNLWLTAIQANHMAFEGLVTEPDGVNDVEACLSECTDGAGISRGRISDDRTDVAVRENVVRSELADDRGPKPATRHLDFSY